MKEYKITAVARIDNSQVDFVGLKSRPSANVFINKMPQIIMRTDIKTGATTGPIQGNGIKNKTSQSVKDNGQSMVAFRKI